MRLSESVDKKLLLSEESLQPPYMTNDIIPAVNDIKNNQAKISFALPWRIELIVRANTNTGSKYWVLEYIKDNKLWRLGGLQESGSSAGHTP